WLWDRPFTVVGVAAKGHSAPGRTGPPPAFWVSLASHADGWRGSSKATADEIRERIQLLTAAAVSADERLRLAALAAEVDAPPPAWNPPVDVFARFKPGVSASQAESEVRAITSALAEEHFGRLNERAKAVRLSSVSLESLNERDRESGVIVAVMSTIIAL